MGHLDGKNLWPKRCRFSLVRKNQGGPEIQGGLLSHKLIPMHDT